MTGRLVSIIIPTHNRASMLGNALASIVKQTYENWEAIVISNGCQDSTGELVKRYLIDKRFKVIDLQNAVGGAAARNIGLRAARGEVIAFLDDDDQWLPHKLQTQVETLTRVKDVAIVSCKHIKLRRGRYTIDPDPEFVEWSDLLMSNVLGSFSFLVARKEAVQGIWVDERLNACQDWCYCLEILKRSQMMGYIVQEPLVLYNHNTDYNRLTLNRQNKYGAYKRFLEKYSKYMNKKELAHHLSELYMRKNLTLDRKALFPKLSLSLATFRFICLSDAKKLTDIKRTLKMVVLPLANLEDFRIWL